MIANHGYSDGSGEFFISIDTGKCDGCGACMEACPARLFKMIENEFDLDAEHDVSSIRRSQTRRLKDACAVCKPSSGYDKDALPCVTACLPGAIAHSW